MGKRQPFVNVRDGHDNKRPYVVHNFSSMKINYKF